MLSDLKPVYALLALGLSMIATGYVLGERITGIATVLEIVGMGITWMVVVSIAWAYYLVHRKWTDGLFP